MRYKSFSEIPVRLVVEGPRDRLDHLKMETSRQWHALCCWDGNKLIIRLPNTFVERVVRDAAEASGL